MATTVLDANGDLTLEVITHFQRASRTLGRSDTGKDVGTQILGFLRDC